MISGKSTEQAPRNGGWTATVVRLGRTRDADTFVDFARSFPSTQLIIVSTRAELVRAKINLTACHSRQEPPENIRVVGVRAPPLAARAAGRLGRKLQLVPLELQPFTHEAREARRWLKSADVVWIGESDFDRVFERALAVRRAANDRTTIVAGLKETRFKKKRHEYLGLGSIDGLIVPHPGYGVFFDELYGLDLPLVEYGDPNWPSAGKAQRAQDKSREKVRARDGRIHVCLVAGRLLSDSKEGRSGPRYDMVESIRQLAANGFAVDVFAGRVEPDASGVDQYARLESTFPHVRVLPPLDLNEGCRGFSVLSRYDLGLLHPAAPQSAMPLWRFQQINIPRRLFDYLLGQVVPIVASGALPMVSEISEQLKFPLLEFRSAAELKERATRMLSKDGDLWSDFEMPTYERYCASFGRLARRLGVRL